MTLRRVLLALPLFVEASSLGSELKVGTRLTYASEAGEQPAWRVDSLVRGLAHEGRTGCVFVRFAPSDARTVCAAGDTIVAWSAAARRWSPSRTIGAHSRLEIAQPSGARVVYTTGAVEADTISGRTLSVVVTRVSTFDSTGREVRRLDERYAPGLLTATSGVFAVPDSAREGEWRTTRSFRLIRIE